MPQTILNEQRETFEWLIITSCSIKVMQLERGHLWLCAVNQWTNLLSACGDEDVKNPSLFPLQIGWLSPSVLGRPTKFPSEHKRPV